MAFEIGQLVKCIDPRNGLIRGHVYSVVDLDGPNYVKVANAQEWFRAERFELIDHPLNVGNQAPVAPQAPLPRAYQVGDRVRFTGACELGWSFGPHKQDRNVHTGTIFRLNEGNGRYKYNVRVDSGFAGSVSDEHIELIRAADGFWGAGLAEVLANPFPAAPPPVPQEIQRDRYTLYLILAGSRVAPQRFNYVSRRDADQRIEALQRARTPILATKELSFSY